MSVIGEESTGGANEEGHAGKDVVSFPTQRGEYLNGVVRRFGLFYDLILERDDGVDSDDEVGA